MNRASKISEEGLCESPTRIHYLGAKAVARIDYASTSHESGLGAALRERASRDVRNRGSTGRHVMMDNRTWLIDEAAGGVLARDP